MFDPDQELAAILDGTIEEAPADTATPPAAGFLAFEAAVHRATHEHPEGCRNPWYPGAVLVTLTDHDGRVTEHELRHPSPLSCVTQELLADDRLANVTVGGWRP